jgi:hypothetical protein
MSMAATQAEKDAGPATRQHHIPTIMEAESLLQASPRCRDDCAEMFLDRLGAAASAEG